MNTPREEYVVYGVGFRHRAWAPGKMITVCATKEEADAAADAIRWRRINRPTRIVRRLADPPFTPSMEWRIEA